MFILYLFTGIVIYVWIIKNKFLLEKLTLYTQSVLTDLQL